MVARRFTLAVLFLVVAPLSACASKPTRYTTADPAAALVGVTRALEECGYEIHAGTWGDVSGHAVERAPKRSAGETGARVVGATVLYGLFSLASFALGGEGISPSDVGSVGASEYHCSAQFRVGPRDGGGSELRLWVAGVPQPSAAQRTEALWEAVGHHLALDPAPLANDGDERPG